MRYRVIEVYPGWFQVQFEPGDPGFWNDCVLYKDGPLAGFPSKEKAIGFARALRDGPSVVWDSEADSTTVAGAMEFVRHLGIGVRMK